jgi:hypothetical protein
MRHVVLSHTVSPRTSPGPRNTVPQDTGRAQEHRPCPRTPSGLKAHCWYSSPLLVLKPIVGTQTHCWYSNPLSVLKPIVGTQAHCRYSGPLSVLKAHCRCSSPLSGLKPIVGTQAHCRDSSPLPGLKPIAGTQAHCRDSSPLPVPKDNTGTHAQAVPQHTGRAQTAQPWTGAQHHARPCRTSACSCQVKSRSMGLGESP